MEIPLGGPRQVRGPSTSWWAGRWLRSLGNWMGTNALATGRLYVRREQVRDLEVQVGVIVGTVQEPDGSACQVRLAMATHTDAAWGRVIGLMARRATYAAHLLNGEVPHDVEDLFAAAGLGLFPDSRAELEVECSCAEWTAACRHVAAVAVLVGDLLDEDPFLLFRLRGRTREQLMAALREQHAAQGAEAEGESSLTVGGVSVSEPIGNRLHDFWRMGPQLGGLSIRVRPPEVDLEALKLLGMPSFADDPALVDRLAEVYRIVSRRALEVAYEEHEQPPEPDGEHDEHDEAAGSSAEAPALGEGDAEGESRC